MKNSTRYEHNYFILVLTVMLERKVILYFFFSLNFIWWNVHNWDTHRESSCGHRVNFCTRDLILWFIAKFQSFNYDEIRRKRSRARKKWDENMFPLSCLDVYRYRVIQQSTSYDLFQFYPRSTFIIISHTNTPSPFTARVYDWWTSVRHFISWFFWR